MFCQLIHFQGTRSPRADADFVLTVLRAQLVLVENWFEELKRIAGTAADARRCLR
jgi:hypothetical protein